MATVDLSIAREYFEMNGFFVRQLRKHPLKQRRTSQKKQEEAIDLMVINPRPFKAEQPLGFMLFTNDLPFISRAILCVKGWHTMNFSPSTLKSSSEIFNFLQMDVLKKAEELFPQESETGEALEPFKKILVLPGLPLHEPHRTQSMDLLRKHGVDGIFSFRAMLQDIIAKVEVNQNYENSELLQTLRILKNYDMLRSPQMELFTKKNK